MKSVNASEFKNKCLQLIKEVAETGVSVVITKDGQPVAQLGPPTPRLATLAGAHKGKITVAGDILAPLDEDWETGH